MWASQVTNRPIDAHPARRERQVAEARAVLHSGEPVETAELRHACAVLLALSDDPGARLMATEILRRLDE